MFFSGFFDEQSSKEKHLFEIEIFLTFAVIFDQFNASLLNKSTDFFTEIALTPNNF